jgi:hypothetical protein
MPNAPAKEPRESRGNGCLLVIGDSTQAEFAHLPEVIFAAFDHFGMPYRLHDLAQGRLTGLDSSAFAGIVVAQEHLGSSLTPTERGVLLQAVETGLGLVNFDHDVEAYGGELQAALGLRGAGHDDSPAADGVETIVVSDDDHFISSTQDTGAAHRLRMPVPASLTRVHRSDMRVLAESDQEAPVLLAGRVGRGKVVQWLASPRLWLRQYLGHAHGLDDLFWKGIVWAARKPFVMKAMPPFVRLRFDDCNGLWRNAEDFRFVDVLNEAGHRPSLCICMRAVAADGARKLHELHARGLVEIAPHTLKPGTGIFYGDERGENSAEELRRIMQEVEEHLRRWEITPSKILSDHDHEYSSRVLPLLKERGICFKMNVTLPDERWTEIHRDWRPAPYGSMSYALDYLPDTRDLFVVFNHYPAFDYARAYLPDGRFVYNRAGGFGQYTWDFLNGLTTYRGLRPENDIKAAAERLATHTRLGLDSLFFGGSISHSHFTQGLSEREWTALLEHYEARTQRYTKLNAGYDFVADYARAKVDTHLARVERDEDAQIVRCTVVGETRIDLRLSVFRDVDSTVEHGFETVPAFRGQTDMKFGIKG